MPFDTRSLLIASIAFTRCGADDEWLSECERIRLRLDMITPEHPWRTAIDNRWLKSNWSTPYVAIKRTRQRL